MRPLEDHTRKQVTDLYLWSDITRIFDAIKDSLKKEYDVVQKFELLDRFNKESQYWRPVIVGQLGRRVADTVLREAYEEFEALIPQIPYIGGDENHLTEYLIGSVRYRALYKAMKKQSNTAEETGKILYDAILARMDEPRVPILPSQRLTTEYLMERRRKRAERSQERRYPQDYVCEEICGEHLAEHQTLVC